MWLTRVRLVACQRATQREPAWMCSDPILFAFLASPCLWRMPEWPMPINVCCNVDVGCVVCGCEIWWDAFNRWDTARTNNVGLCYRGFDMDALIAIISLVQAGIMRSASADNVDRDNLLPTQRLILFLTLCITGQREHTYQPMTMNPCRRWQLSKKCRCYMSFPI